MSQVKEQLFRIINFIKFLLWDNSEKENLNKETK